MAKVSIVIPVYNKGNFIARSLESVLMQSYNDYEIIVIDDGSTDDGLEIVQKFREPRLRIVSQANAGPGSARNLGIKISTAPLVTFLDADDQWLPGFLETSVNNLQDHPDCALSVCAHCVGEERSLWPGAKMIDISRGPWRLPVDMEPSLVGTSLAFIHSAGAVLARREIITRYGGFYEKGCVYGEDLYLWLQVMLNHKIFRDTNVLFWQHTEASELVHDTRAVNRVNTLMPFLTDPAVIRKRCPVEYKRLLKLFLARQALCEAFDRAFYGNLSTAGWLLQNYPSMKCWRLEYLKLKCKMSFPSTTRYLSNARKYLGTAHQKEVVYK
jgi:glycosyltransferase involved in cell wall biosynthesis